MTDRLWIELPDLARLLEPARREGFDDVVALACDVRELAAMSHSRALPHEWTSMRGFGVAFEPEHGLVVVGRGLPWDVFLAQRTSIDQGTVAAAVEVGRLRSAPRGDLPPVAVLTQRQGPRIRLREYAGDGVWKVVGENRVQLVKSLLLKP